MSEISCKISSKCWGKITGCLKSISSKTSLQGIPRNQSGKESSWQGRRCRRHRFSPRVGKICQRRRWRPTPVFLSGGSQGQRSLSITGGLQSMGLQTVGHYWSDLARTHRQKRVKFTLESWKNLKKKMPTLRNHHLPLKTLSEHLCLLETPWLVSNMSF